MRVLALDTTTRARSAALVEDDRIVVERTGDPSRSHGDSLPGDLQATLDAAGAGWSSVDIFAVASGPGSFTGLRIGIATMQGLAFVTGRRMAAVSALEALAQAASRGLTAGAVVGAWIDAHRRDVFSALYRVDARPGSGLALLTELDGPAVHTPAATLARWSSCFALPDVIIGDGALQYPDVLIGRVPSQPAPPLASWIGLMAVGRARAGGTIDPAAVQPLYVRRPDAEIARERREAPRLPELRNPNPEP
jgi:tRNA threonylcarbamoyladenosine biosynthesis protein TsaB